jgi:class 3 adenylate cyclase
VALAADLQTEVKAILSKTWTTRDGQVVPAPSDLKLGNDAVKLNATVLYADMNGSTNLVDTHTATTAAEVYKIYMACTARIIKNAGGTITAYDGDRIMGLFIGDYKNTTAAKTALQINWAVKHIVNPSLKAQYGNDAYQMNHGIGVDTSTILAARIGVRNDNDVVWVGRAANYAAKLTSVDTGHAIYITGDVFAKLDRPLKYNGTPEQLMWEPCTWNPMNKMAVHRSNWTWAVP